MPEQTPQASGTRKPHAGLLWLSASVPLLVIALTVVSYLYLTDEGPAPPAPEHPAEPQPLVGDYYVMARTIELYPTRPGGKAWDRVDGSGPDIDYELSWQGNVVFEAGKKSDTLIATWDAISLDLKSAILSQKVDLSGSIDAAIIRIDADTDVTLSVWDSDVTGNDTAGTMSLHLHGFKPGDNVIEMEASEDNAIKRVVVRLIDKSLPLTELVEEAMRP